MSTLNLNIKGRSKKKEDDTLRVLPSKRRSISHAGLLPRLALPADGDDSASVDDEDRISTRSVRQRGDTAESDVERQNRELLLQLERQRKYNEDLELKIRMLLATGSPQVFDLKEEIVKLSHDLQTIKRKQFQEMQNLATSMNQQNAQAMKELKALQEEYNLPPMLLGQIGSRSDSSEPNTPKGINRTRSSSFAAKMKGLFSKSPNSARKKKSHSRESSKDTYCDGTQ